MDEEDGDTVIADDISADDANNPNEITSSEVLERQYARQRHSCWMITLIVSTFLCSVLIASVKFFAPKVNDELDIFGGGDYGGFDSPENQRRFGETLAYLVTKEVSDIITLLPNNTLSPQYMAAKWIAAIDNHRINIPKPDGTTSKDEYPFLQRYSLAVLFFSTGGFNWIYRMNFLSGRHECEWFDLFQLPDFQAYLFGLMCDRDPGPLTEQDQNDNLWTDYIVTDIHLLPLNNVVGTLPSELRHLRYLKSLRIYSQAINGEIPSQYSDLKNLKALELDMNEFEGKLPDLDLPDLELLALSFNHFTGLIPQSMSQLTRLEMLGLDNNNLTGTLDVLEGMTSLTHVYLENNDFDHDINDDFFVGLKNLTHLDISNCSIRGFVPAGLFLNFPKIEVLDLSRNMLGGDLPILSNTSFETTSNLTYLSLFSNNISGPIPDGISLLTSLKHLDLSDNQLFGYIIEELGSLNALEYLFLAKNDFKPAPFPEWLRNLTNLKELSLKSNNLIEEIPEWIGELNQLELLDLGVNELAGTLPDSMGNLTNLWILILNSNDLRGTIPSTFRQMKDLEIFIIDDNNLKGNADPICENRGFDRITHFVSDCASNSSTSSFSTSAPGSIGGWDDPVLSWSAEIECECCTLCCTDENTTCNDYEWLSSHDGMWQFGYERAFWNFDENGIVSEQTDSYDTLYNMLGP